MPTDQRLIEDYLPIQAISAEATREKSIRLSSPSLSGSAFLIVAACCTK
jgi:hypothetical protein